MLVRQPSSWSNHKCHHKLWKLVPPVIAASELQARLWRTIVTAVERACFRVLKRNQKQAPQVHISWRGRRNPKRPGLAASMPRSPWLRLGRSTTASGPLIIAKLVLPIYFLIITYSISCSISYIVFYNYLFLSLNLEGKSIQLFKRDHFIR